MPEVDADWKPVAFKEWRVVCDALESGEQSIILRKGGISEGKRGFQWIHDRFFLFPTFFHEQVDQVKPGKNGQKRAILEPDAGNSEIEIRLFVEIIEKGHLSDWESIERLDDGHIWTEEVIRKRYEWGDEPGINFARVCIWKLRNPWILADRNSFGGCRSWIDLPLDEDAGHPIRERLATAEPGSKS